MPPPITPEALRPDIDGSAGVGARHLQAPQQPMEGPEAKVRQLEVRLGKEMSVRWTTGVIVPGPAPIQMSPDAHSFFDHDSGLIGDN